MGACNSCGKSGEKPVASIKKYEERSCTDILCLLLFIAGWAVVFIVLGAAIPKSEPNKLVKGVDYKGCVCGEANAGSNDCRVDKTDFPYAAWPNPMEYNFKICRADCDTGLTDPDVLYATKRFVFYCVPDPSALLSNESSLFNAAFASSAALASRAFGDLKTTWGLILGCTFFAAVFSFIYAFILRKIAKFLVWFSLILVIVGGFLVAYGLISYAKEARDSGMSTDRANAMEIIGYISAVATFLFLCLIVFLRKRIMIAIEVVRETCSAVVTMPTLSLFPFWPFFLICIYFIFWIIVALYIFAVTNEVTLDFPTELPLTKTYASEGTYISTEWDESMQASIAVHFFHLLWNLNFIIYFGFFVISGAVAQWYFTRYDENGEKPRGEEEGQLTNWAVSRSAKRTARFHLGTIAFGSLLIAIIQFIRAVVLYFEKKAKKTPYETLRKVIFCLINCCLYCMECCMDKLNKNGYIWCAVYGDSFCTSCCSAFGVVYRNLARVVAMSIVGDSLVLLGKIVISLVPTGIAGMILTKTTMYENTLNSIIMPIFVIFVISFTIGSVFMSVFDTAADTIFLCFMIDSENNAPENMFASKTLLELIDAHKDESKEEAKLLQRDGHDETYVKPDDSATEHY